ncbi:hypothetical protein C9J12_29425 [Photobacterium frigidiphilum]|uniref:Type-F conjugative transfer system protein TrbI n=1 Tax=Photobacterium frigidiphilum TaxID=264736 RepID=A0A2T3J5U1_9GAMM|nr:TrbI F-type domain-containing protein [Photobacterium frigidiphilum]PSU41775.1 hypothetical protein C9J12_29425 [Photobacterium frigidiphilum]
MSPRRTVTLSVTLSLLVSATVCLLGVGPFNPTPALVHMDMKGTLAAFEKDIAKRALSPAQQRNQASRFSAALEDVLYAYGIEKNVVIVVTPALVAGAPDVTRDIQQRTLNALTKEE